MPEECFKRDQTAHPFSPEGTGLTIRELDEWAESLVQTIEAYRARADVCRQLNEQREVDQSSSSNMSD
jgi:hypothetical protein